MEVDVMNVSGEPQVLTVEIKSNEETTFQRKYDLTTDEGDLSGSVAGIPDTVSVDVKDGTSQTFEYRPPTYCLEDSDQDPKIVLTIYDADEVELTYGCAR